MFYLMGTCIWSASSNDHLPCSPQASLRLSALKEARVDSPAGQEAVQTAMLDFTDKGWTEIRQGMFSVKLWKFPCSLKQLVLKC